MPGLFDIGRKKFTYVKTIVILIIAVQSFLLYKSFNIDGSGEIMEGDWRLHFIAKNYTRGNEILPENQPGFNITNSSLSIDITRTLPYEEESGKWDVHEKVSFVGSNYKGERLFDDQQNITPYLLIVPRYVVNAVNSIESFRSYNQQTLRTFVHALDNSPYLDGVFGENDMDGNGDFDDSAPCVFSRRETTLLIRNSGEFSSTPVRHQACNMAVSSFLIRSKVFQKYKWIPEMGILSVLHFFVHAGGNIRLGKLSVSFSKDEIEDFTKTDRGLLKGTRDFNEYQDFGIRHNILRLVYEDRVEWMHCASHWALCKEEPYTKPQRLPQIAMPLCCSHCLDVYLQDITQALTAFNFEYRVIYGTLLGAVRSQAIIPWTFDIDIGVTHGNYWNNSFYEILQDYLGDRYWIGFSYIDTYRMHALFAPSLKANFSEILNRNPDVLFTNEITEAIEKLSPIVSGWRYRGYVDFYPSPEVWLDGSAQVTINGRNYTTLAKIEYELENWFGANFRKPVLQGQWVGRTDLGQS